jgi:hypothetical protein
LKKATGERRRPHNEKLKDSYCSPNIIWVIKSEWMRLAGLVECMAEKRYDYKFLMEKYE